ncbi:hypothetical protein [Microbacterium imperiale]|nr:hypothetical protein [Microbacterium imperiale]
MSASTPTTRSTGLRTSMYLLHLDWHLEGAVPAAERRHILRALRQEIDADPRPLGVALADLGSPRALALRYGEGGQPRPLWSIGVVVAGAILVAYWLLFGTFAGGMLAVVDNAAPMSAEATFLFVTVVAFSDDQGVGIGWASGPEWFVVPGVMVALALLLGARAWRLVPRRARA